jgi:CheY-like chemotaxis protein
MMSMEWPLRIIIVDDDAGVRKVLQRMLLYILPGCRIALAADGFEALRLYEQERTDLVITNMGMQPVNGLHLLTTLRAREARIPIVLTADALISDRMVRIGGATRFLTKPFTLNECKAAVLDALHEISPIS